MKLSTELHEPHRIFVELVWSTFRDAGKWPTAEDVVNALLPRIDPTMDVHNVFRTIPSVIGYAQIADMSEVVITPIAMAVVVPVDARQALDDFFSALQLCQLRYLTGPTDRNLHLESQADLAEQLGLDALRIRQAYLLLRQAGLLTGASDTWLKDDGEQYGWDQVIYRPTINRYREVQTIDEYLDELYRERNENAGSANFVREGLPIEPVKVVRFSPETVSPAAAIAGDIYNINISDSTVGNVVAGSTINSIESNIDASRGVSGDELADALKAIAEACLADNALEPEQVHAAADLIEYLSEAAAAPEDQRRRSVIGASLKALGAIMAFAATTGEVWQQWAPILEQAFHVGGH